MNRVATILLTIFISFAALASPSDRIVVGAERIAEYLPLVKGKRVGIVTNHSGIVKDKHIVDTLLALGVDIRLVFAPEHGFRGDADAGEKVGSYRDKATGIDVVSLYGANRKPKISDLQRVDVVLFDIQDVGLRYYTYLSTMHLVMEGCAQTARKMIILDRPNPNGSYVDGPVLKPKFKSFVGMHPIPVVHGMTLGELAMMINGEGWLEGAVKCDVTVIKCINYTRRSRYELPLAPSPNLPNMLSVYLYSSLCLMEGTVVSIGRGTSFPFQVYGHPDFKNKEEFTFKFTPTTINGAINPPQQDKECYGVDLRIGADYEEIISKQINLNYVISCYSAIKNKDIFFNPMFDKLMGTDLVRQMIVEGRSNEQIRASWKGEVESFLDQREKYLLYQKPFKFVNKIML